MRVAQMDATYSVAYALKGCYPKSALALAAIWMLELVRQRGFREGTRITCPRPESPLPRSPGKSGVPRVCSTRATTYPATTAGLRRGGGLTTHRYTTAYQTFYFWDKNPLEKSKEVTL